MNVDREEVVRMCPPRGRRRASPHWHLLDATSPTSSRPGEHRPAQRQLTNPATRRRRRRPRASQGRRPHHRKVHTRQRPQAAPQKARSRRAVATAEAKQVEVRSLRVGLQVAKQQQQRGNGSAAREVGGTNRKGAAPESSQVPGPRRGRGDATGGAILSTKRAVPKATRRRAPPARG